MLDKTETEPAKASDLQKRISKPKLKELMSNQRSHKDALDSRRGKMGKDVAVAVEKYNLDKKMFGWIMQLDKMSPERLAYHLDNLDHMRDISGLDDRAATAPRFDTEAGGEDEEAGDE